MLAQDTIPNAPNLIFAVLTLPALAIWVLSIVHWMIQGDIDAPVGMLGLFLAAGIGIGTLKAPQVNLPPALCAFAWLVVILYSSFKNRIEKAQLAAIELDVLANAYGQLRENPSNIGSKLKVAKLIYDRGLVGPAITVAESALKGMPAAAFEAELKMLEEWKQRAGNPTAFRSLPCLECGYANAAGMLECGRCKAPFLLHYAQGKWLGPNLARRVVCGFSAVVLPLVGGPFAASYLSGWRFAVVLAGLGVATLGLALLAVIPEKRRTIH